MRTRTAAAVTAALLLTLAVCTGSTNPEGKAGNPVTKPSETTADQRDSPQAAAGLPPAPSAMARRAFPDTLNAFDPDRLSPEYGAIHDGSNAVITAPT